MKIPLQITYRDLDQNELVDAYIRQRAMLLDKFAPRLVGCKVVIASPHRHQRVGRIFDVRVDMTLPGGELVVSNQASVDHAHEDVFVAIRDAFDAARRQLEDYSRRHGWIKHRPSTQAH